MIILSLQSGTSVDGIDAAMVEFTTAGDPLRPEVSMRSRWARTIDWEADVRRRILAYADGAALDAGEHTRLNTAVGQGFAQAAATAIAEAGYAPDLVVSHGQTVFHWVADGRARGTLQLGEPAWIAEATGAPVLAHLRAADIAGGGQGAPLMGLLDGALWGAGALGDPTAPTPEGGAAIASLNLGGIANLQILRGDGSVLAFDSGPANVLIDASIAAATHGAQGYDQGGDLARSGTVHEGVLEALRSHPYFALPAPKSTGRETFTLDVVHAATAGVELSLPDLCATLTRLSAVTIAAALRTSGPAVRTLVASGGGVLNAALMDELSTALAPLNVRLLASSALGIDPEFKESLMFAFLGFCSWHRLPISLIPGISRIAGSITPAPSGFTLPAPLTGIAGLSIGAPAPCGKIPHD